LVTIALFAPLLLGLMALVWPLLSHYMEGYYFRPESSAQQYISQGLILIGSVTFVLLLGLLAFLGLRGQVGPQARWIALALTLSLIPLAVVILFMGPACRARGVAAGYKALDGTALAADAVTITRLFAMPYDHVLTIGPFDSDYARLPAFTRDTLKPLRINVYANGVVYVLEEGNSYGLSPTHSGVCVPVHKTGNGQYLQSEIEVMVRTSGMTQLVPGQPVLRYVDCTDDFPQLKDPPDPNAPPTPVPAP